MGSRTSTLYVPAEEDNAAEEIRGKILSIDEIVKRHHPPSNGTHSAPTVPTISRIPSIDELVSAHRARVSDASPKHSWSLPTSRASNGMKGRASAPPMVESPDDMQELDETSPRSSLDSLDAISAETTHCLSIHSPQIGQRSTSGAFFDTPPSSVDPSNDAESVQRKPIVPPPSLQSEHDRKIAEYLRSRRLTRLVTVSAPTGKLTVSLADVGAPTGHPVIVFLGLGCVRYLVALYDELAEIMGLRLICIDRWGLGRTDDIPERKRGFLEWSSVVEQVADQLQLPTFSVVAHSAGAPYALATSLKLSLRITGSLHLLAPWVNASVEGQAATYKWLKYVPKTVIQTAQAAEWKLTAWKLGKPPELAYAPVGNDPRAPVSFLGRRLRRASARRRGSTTARRRPTRSPRRPDRASASRGGPPTPRPLPRPSTPSAPQPSSRPPPRRTASPPRRRPIHRPPTLPPPF
jgi:pimeloyl-ACP methyl ester carboxylesterase